MSESTGAQLKKTAKHSAIYAVGTMIRRLTGLVMLPIYTRYLSPADYGTVELLTMAIEIAGILVGLRISQALFRFYILADSDEEKNTIVSTVLLTVVASSAIGAVILFAFSSTLTLLIFGNLNYAYEFQLFTLTLVTNAIAAVGLSFVRARQKPVLFVSIGILSLMLQVALNVYFVVMLELHVTGVVYSSLISGALIALCLSAYVVFCVGLHYSMQIAWKLVRYVAPLMLASLAAFYVAYADKYFLRMFTNLTEVGLYTLAARVSGVLTTVFEAFNMSWGADRFEIVKNDNARAIYEQIFRFLSAVMILVGAGLALFSNDFFRIMTSPAFYPAGYIVPVLVLAFTARIYTVYCNFGSLYMDRTSIMAQASWIKAVLATAGYVSLIPLMGMYGAAVSLALGSCIELVWVHTRSARLYDMGLKWAPVAGMLVAAVISVASGLVLPAGEAVYFVLRVLIYLCLVTTIYFLPIWQEDERIMMKTAVRRVFNFLLVKRSPEKL